MTDFFVGAIMVFLAAFIVEFVFLGLARIFGIYAVVQERTARVYMLFGKVIGILDEPGLYFLPGKLGPAAFVINFLGNCYVLDLRLDQEYLRSQPVNSEEGAPMGIGIWYEMWISDPVSYLFKNTDPRGSLRANVSNATVRCLSNMKLAEMLETRHNMSQTVRAEVTGKSQAWGYQLGSVYIRKVHFRDAGMIKQIEEKVVNRLRQVTSAIKPGGRQPGERDHQFGGARSGRGVRQGRGHSPGHAGASLAGDRPRAGGIGSALRCAGDAAHSRRHRALHFIAWRTALPHSGELAGCGRRLEAICRRVVKYRCEEDSAGGAIRCTGIGAAVRWRLRFGALPPSQQQADAGERGCADHVGHQAEERAHRLRTGR